MKKKGVRSAGNAAALIVIIGIIVVVYILLLPADVRRDILENQTENGNSNGNNHEDEEEKILFSEFVGRLEYFSEDEFEEELPDIVLSRTTQAGIIKSFNDFTVKNAWFDKKEQSLSFKIDDLDNTENVNLVFAAKKHKGNLIITLNSEEIFNNEISTYNVNPIILEESYLRENNELIFSVSSPGLMFWKTNEYSLENIKAMGDITDISGQEGILSFSLSNEDYYNLDTANLRFIPYCRSDEIGKLSIELNRNLIYPSSIPVCDDLYDIPFSTDYLKKGDNKLSFETQEGYFSIEQLKIYGDLKDVKAYTRYFELNASQYEDVIDNNRSVNISIAFVDDNEDKEAELSVNGHITMIDQDEPTYSKTVDSWIEKGNNWFRIDPKTTLEIVEVKVILHEN